MQETFSRVLKVVYITTILVAVSSTLPLCQASIIPTFTAGPIANGTGAFIYSYTANLQEDERLDPAATNGATCLSLTNPVACNPPGTFFTIYDIQGYLSSSTSAQSWAITTQSTGVTPSTTLPVDDPNLVNVTFFYTGAILHANGVVVPISGFQIVSSLEGTIRGVYTSQATKDTGVASGTTDQTIGNVTVPNNGSGPLGNPTPESGTASMLFIGIAGVTASLLWKRGSLLAAARRHRD